MTVLVIALGISIALTVFAYGLNASTSSLTHLVRRPQLLVVDAPDATKLAVVTLALSPVPTLVAKNQLFTGSRAAFAVSLTVVSSAAAVVLTPLMAALIGAILGEPIYVRPAALAARVLGFIVIPLGLGIALRHRRPELADRVRRPALRLSRLGLAGAVVVLLVVTWDEILAAAAPSTLALMVVFVLAGILVAHAAMRGFPDEAHVLATVNFSRHPAIAISIASTTHPTTELAAVILLYVVIAAAVAAAYRAVVLRRDRAAPSASGS